MLSDDDFIGKTTQLYMDAREVPYATFMHFFTALTTNSTRVIPKEPREELYLTMRAACMAANVGVVDREGRADERLREFRDNILSYWQRKLPPEQFAEYEDILSGALRTRRRVEQAEKTAAGPEARAKRLYEQLGLEDLEVEAKPERVEVQDVELPKKLQPVRTYESVEALCRAIREGALEVAYAPAAEAGPLAYYKLLGQDVTVKLAEVEGQEYTVLSVDIGRAFLGDEPTKVDDFAAEMGYLRMTDYAYMLIERDFVTTLKVGGGTTSLACAAQDEAGSGEVIVRINRLHRDLGELIERFGAD